jgi:alpha-glucoside transport system permease protein
VDVSQFLGVQLPTLVAVLIGVPLALAAYIIAFELLVRRLPERAQPAVRPWIWVGPALVFIAVFLVYPALQTILISFQDNHGGFVGLDNFKAVLTDQSVIKAVRNNVYWLVFYTGFALLLGVLLAVLGDRVRYETPVKALIFMPMAISFVALGVIWKFVYSYQPPGAPQTGTLNAIVTGVFHAQPILWIQNFNLSNLALIVAAIWGITGFAMVILSAALKGIPAELLEAARVDGAGEVTIFRRVIVPLLMPTIVVVGTTLVIFALKAFDVVYVMTAGNYDSDVLARRMYAELFQFFNNGRASAIAVILLIAVIPVLIFNLRQFRAVEARR